MSRKERILEKLRSFGSSAPKRSLGQNFLVSDHVIEKILSAVKSAPFSALVEVGPGLGALTDDLLTLQTPLTLLELDRDFAAAWRLRPEVRVLEGDALQLDWAKLELPEDTVFVSNLPYQISSSLVIERSLDGAGITRMVLMFQKEVAQRIAAKATTKEYGLLTVIAQTFWETNTVCDAGPQAFFPAPNVSSRVLQFRRRTLPPEAAELAQPRIAAAYLAFVKAAFSQRRKLMIRNLQGVYFGGSDDALVRIEQALQELGHPRTARAEELDPPTFVRLYLRLRK